MVEDILCNPENLWCAIASVSESEWKSKHDEYKLHRYPAGHDRLWKIARRISEKYDGDARRLWEGGDPGSVLEKLLELGAGDQISRMIVGALRDCGQLPQAASDVKGDVYVCRVLGRALEGQQVDAEAAVELARQIYPGDPWQLDAVLWQIGKDHCHRTSPNCSQCCLVPHCIYALQERAEAEVAGVNSINS